jgi:hypothetical protein
MLRSSAYQSFDAWPFEADRDAYMGIVDRWTWTRAAANVQVVLAGLNRSDVDFFYKQFNGYSDSYGDRQWTGGPDYKELGFIQIKATGETLVLPEGELVYPPQYGDEYYPPNFSIEFADGTSVTGAALANLFDQQGASETDYWYTEGGGNWNGQVDREGDLDNAPAAYLVANNNAATAAPPTGGTGGGGGSHAGPIAHDGSLTIGHDQSETITAFVNDLVTPGAAGDTRTITTVNGNAVVSNGGTLHCARLPHRVHCPPGFKGPIIHRYEAARFATHAPAPGFTKGLRVDPDQSAEPERKIQSRNRAERDASPRLASEVNAIFCCGLHVTNGWQFNPFVGVGFWIRV